MSLRVAARRARAHVEKLLSSEPAVVAVSVQDAGGRAPCVRVDFGPNRIPASDRLDAARTSAHMLHGVPVRFVQHAAPIGATVDPGLPCADDAPVEPGQAIYAAKRGAVGLVVRVPEHDATIGITAAHVLGARGQLVRRRAPERREVVLGHTLRGVTPGADLRVDVGVFQVRGGAMARASDVDSLARAARRPTPKRVRLRRPGRQDAWGRIVAVDATTRSIGAAWRGTWLIELDDTAPALPGDSGGMWRDVVSDDPVAMHLGVVAGSPIASAAPLGDVLRELGLAPRLSTDGARLAAHRLARRAPSGRRPRRPRVTGS